MSFAYYSAVRSNVTHVYLISYLVCNEADVTALGTVDVDDTLLLTRLGRCITT